MTVNDHRSKNGDRGFILKNVPDERLGSNQNIRNIPDIPDFVLVKSGTLGYELEQRIKLKAF
jgi:hypothetical protein